MTPTFAELLKRISSNEGCIVEPPSTPPSLPSQLGLVPGFTEFYSECNGASLFTDKGYSYRILKTEEVRPLNREIDGECECNGVVISDSWLFIAEDHDGQKLAIDTALGRRGRVYDCFFGNDYQIIATSFHGLLEKLFQGEGEYPYWLKDDFESLGNACIF